MILQRIEGSRFSRVLPAWRGEVVALLAGGPSLTPDLFRLVAGARAAGRVRVIAINDSYLLAPWADVSYAADVKWHRWHTAGIEKPLLGLTAVQVRDAWATFAGEKCSIQPSAEHVPDAVHILRNRHDPYHGPRAEISRDPEFLVTGRHGGFQALNIAILAGARAVLLLGYDACLGEDGRPHWHGEHPVPSRAEDSYQAFRRSFSEAHADIIATGAQVLNCSLSSRIDTFAKVSFPEAIERLAP